MQSLSTDVCGICGSLRRCNSEGNSFCTSHTLVCFDDAICGSLRRCNSEGNSFCTSHTLVCFDDAEVNFTC